jgi:hypothetical protein
MRYKYKISLLSVAMATIVLASMVATAGVTAAQTVSVNGQVSVVYAGGIEWLFAQSTAGNLVYGEVSGSPGSVANWINLGGPIGSAPAAVSQGGEHVTIYMRSTTGTLVSTTTTDIAGASASSGWSPLTTMTGTVAAGTGPNAVYSASGTDVFYVDSATHALMSDSAATGGLFPSTGNANLGGSVTASPSAAVTSTGGIDVFVRGTQGAVYERMYATGGWSGWTKFHDGTIEAGTGPAAVSNGSNGWTSMTVYVTGTNLHMYSVYSGDDGVTWSTTGHHGYLYWSNWGGVLTSSPSGVDYGTWFVVVRGADNNIWTNVNGIWQAPPPITAPA